MHNTTVLFSSSLLFFLAAPLLRGTQQIPVEISFFFLSTLSAPYSCISVPCVSVALSPRNNTCPAAASPLLQQQRASSNSHSCGTRRAISRSASFPRTSSAPAFRHHVCFCLSACTAPRQTLKRTSAALDTRSWMRLGSALSVFPSVSSSPLAFFLNPLRLPRFSSGLFFTDAPHQHKTLSCFSSSSFPSSSASPNSRNSNILRALSVCSLVTRWGSCSFVAVHPDSLSYPRSAGAWWAMIARWRCPVEAGLSSSCSSSTASTASPPPGDFPSAARSPAARAANNVVPTGCPFSASSGWCIHPAWLQGAWQVHLRCGGLDGTSENSGAKEGENETARNVNCFPLVHAVENDGKKSFFFPFSTSRLIEKGRGREKEKRSSSISSHPISNVDSTGNNCESFSFDANGTRLDLEDEDMTLLLRAFTSIDPGLRMHNNVPGEGYSCSCGNNYSDVTIQNHPTPYVCSSTSAGDVLNCELDNRGSSPFVRTPAHKHWKSCFFWKNNARSGKQRSIQPRGVLTGPAPHMLTPFQQQTLARLQQVIATYELHLEPAGIVRAVSRTPPRCHHGTATTAAAEADEAATAAGCFLIREKERPGACSGHAEIPVAEKVVSQEHAAAAQGERNGKLQQQKVGKLMAKRAGRKLHAESQTQPPHTSQHQVQLEPREQFQNISPAATLQHLQAQLQNLQQQDQDSPEQHQGQGSAQHKPLQAKLQPFSHSQPPQNSQPYVQPLQLSGGSVAQIQGALNGKTHKCMAQRPSAALMLLRAPASSSHISGEIKENQGEVCVPLSWSFNPASRRLVLMLWLPLSMLLLRLSAEIRWRGSSTCAYTEGRLSLPAAPLPVYLLINSRRAASASVVAPAAAGNISGIAPVVAPVAVAAASAVASSGAPTVAPAAVSATHTGPLGASPGIILSAAGFDGEVIAAGREAHTKSTENSSSPVAVSLTVQLQRMDSTVQHRAESILSSAASVTATGRSNGWRRIPNGAWGRGFLYACDQEWTDSDVNIYSETEGSWLLHILPQEKLRNEHRNKVSPWRQQLERSYQEQSKIWRKERRHNNLFCRKDGSKDRQAEELEKMHQQDVYNSDGVHVKQNGQCSDVQSSSMLQRSHHRQEKQMILENPVPPQMASVTPPRIRESGGAALLGEVYIHLTRPHSNTLSTRSTSRPLLPKRGFLLLKTGQQRHAFLQELRVLQQIQLRYLRCWFFPCAGEQLERGDVKTQARQQQLSVLKRLEQSQQQEEEEGYAYRRIQDRRLDSEQQEGQQQEKTMQSQGAQKQSLNQYQEDLVTDQTHDRRKVHQEDKHELQEKEHRGTVQQASIVHGRHPLAPNEGPSLTARNQFIDFVHALFMKREGNWFKLGSWRSRQWLRRKGKGNLRRRSTFRSGKEDVPETRVSVVTVAVEGKVVGWTLPPPALPAAAIDRLSVTANIFEEARGPTAADLPPLLSLEDAEEVVARQKEGKELEVVAVAKKDNCATLERWRHQAGIVKVDEANDYSRRARVEREADIERLNDERQVNTPEKQKAIGIATAAPAKQADTAGGEHLSPATNMVGQGKLLRLKIGTEKQKEAAAGQDVATGPRKWEDVPVAVGERSSTESAADSPQRMGPPPVSATQHFELKQQFSSQTDELGIRKQVQQDVAAAVLHPIVQRKLSFHSLYIKHAVYLHHNRLVNFLLESPLH